QSGGASNIHLLAPPLLCATTWHLCIYVLIPSLVSRVKVLSLGQNFNQFGNVLDATAGVEWNLIANVQTSIRVAHDVHQVHDSVESRCLKSQNPLIVAQCEGRNSVRTNIWIVTCGHTVLHQNLATLFVFQ